MRMKYQLSLLALFAAFTLSSPARAERAPQVDILLAEMRELVLRCAVQPYAVSRSGKKVLGALESLCSEVQLAPRASDLALFQLENGIYRVQVIDSAYSDGGDLVDLIIMDAQGRVLSVVPNILGFSDPLRAILGSQADDLREVYDPTLLHRRG